MMSSPEDTRRTRKRRWLVDLDVLSAGIVGGPSRTLLDRYLTCGQLRLREETEDDTRQRRFSLSKRGATGSSSGQRRETIALDEAEFEALYALDGHDLRKRRFHASDGGHAFLLDDFDSALLGLVLLTTEAESRDELMRIEPPAWVHAEVTGDDFFRGRSLCRLSPEALAVVLRRHGLWCP